MMSIIHHFHPGQINNEQKLKNSFGDQGLKKIEKKEESEYYQCK